VERLMAAERVAEWCADRRSQGRTIGLVPTMGAFHEGHGSLMERARRECDEVVVYLFINPLQFGSGEDLERYPRDLDRDLRIAQEREVDAFFTPTLEDMYPEGYPPPASRTIHPGPLGELYEGRARPGHFEGVLTVVDRLFGIVGKCSAYFGEKDAQQLFLVRQMATARHPSLRIVPCATVREPDGLAMSSRNSYLSSEERTGAVSLSRGLFVARDLFSAGERRSSQVIEAVTKEVGSEPLVALDYCSVVDDGSFEPIEVIETDARVLVAARVGPARLIDNILLLTALG